MPVLHIDFETRSTIDLTVVGLDNYAKHESTDVWCLAYCFDDEPVQLWSRGWPLSAGCTRIENHIRAGGKVVAHNVAFELAIWNNIMVSRHGCPPIYIEQSECTMAMAYAMGLPGSLDRAAPAAGIEARKNLPGHRLMLQMCRPREIKPDGEIVWWDDEERKARLFEYCKQDVEVERQLHKRLRPLSENERAVWQLDYEINQRGVQVDIPSVNAAIQVVRDEQDRLNKRLREVTGNFVGFATEVARLTQWVRTRGVDIPGVSKSDVLDALELDGLPADVREALTIRQEAGRSSTAKLQSLVDAASFDDRVRGTFQYHGAGTGRWAGRKIQPHNFPRGNLKPADVEQFLDLLRSGQTELADVLYGPLMSAVASSIRGMLIPAPGKDFLVGDFANIEGRVLAWSAGEEWKLQAFRDFDGGVGPDIYKLAYAKSFGLPIEEVTKAQRQIGKVEELALGYQGGVGAFQQMAKTYNVTVSDTLADEIKVGWRDAHPAVVRYWYACEEAAIAAVLNPGKVYAAGAKGREVKYRKDGSFLICRLPSGRWMHYPYPKLIEIDTPWGVSKEALTYMTVVDQAKKKSEKIIPDSFANGSWQRVATYGGKLVENNTQAIARDLLAEALLRLEGGGFSVVMHVHDEAVCEIPEQDTYDTEFAMNMGQRPNWAADLPIAVETWRGKRYRKG